MRMWTEQLEDKLRSVPGIADVSSDQDRAGPQVDVVIDRVAAARLGVSVARDRQRAEQRLLAAPDLDHLHRSATSTAWCWRSIPQLQTDPSMLDRIYRRRHRRRAGAAVAAVVAFHARHGAAGGASPGPVPGGDASASTRPTACRSGDATARDPAGGARPAHAGHACAPSSPATPASSRQSCQSQPLLIGAALPADLHRARRALRKPDCTR